MGKYVWKLVYLAIKISHRLIERLFYVFAYLLGRMALSVVGSEFYYIDSDIVLY
jgi:hypothetical protein